MRLVLLSQRLSSALGLRPLPTAKPRMNWNNLRTPHMPQPLLV